MRLILLSVALLFSVVASATSRGLTVDFELPISRTSFDAVSNGWPLIQTGRSRMILSISERNRLSSILRANGESAKLMKNGMSSQALLEQAKSYSLIHRVRALILHFEFETLEQRDLFVASVKGNTERLQLVEAAQKPEERFGSLGRFVRNSEMKTSYVNAATEYEYGADAYLPISIHESGRFDAVVGIKRRERPYGLTGGPGFDGHRTGGLLGLRLKISLDRKNP